MSYFEGTRDGLKKNILIRQKWEMRNKIIHYQKLIDIKPKVDNKNNKFKFENLNPISKKSRLALDRSKEIYKDNMMLLNKLKQIQLRSNSVLGDRSKTALLTKRKRRWKSKTKQNFYSNKNLNSADSFSKKIRNNTAKNVKSHLLGRPQTQQNTHELDQYQNLSENQNLSLEYNTAANANCKLK